MNTRPPLSPLVLPLLGLLLAAPPASSGPQATRYELTVIEPEGGPMFAASGCSDVNDVGLVVGNNWVAGEFIHFEWTVGGGFAYPTHLPPGGARRVNNFGDSVFSSGSASYPSTADLVLADGTHVPIPEPLGGPSHSGKADLNDALAVIGNGVSTGTTSTVFWWSPGGGSLGVLIHAASELRRINAHGVAAGNRLFSGTDTQAFVVDLATQEWVDLHALLPGSGGSEAFDVNDSGAVVGFGPDGTSLSAWVWTATSGFTFLPGLDGGPTMYVRPRAIDNRGRVVGSALTGDDEYHAFLWDPQSGMVDLHARAAVGDFRLIEALDVSENGVIIGRGFHGTAWGPDRGFVLVETAADPTPFGGGAAPMGGPPGRWTVRR